MRAACPVGTAPHAGQRARAAPSHRTPGAGPRAHARACAGTVAEGPLLRAPGAPRKGAWRAHISPLAATSPIDTMTGLPALTSSCTSRWMAWGGGGRRWGGRGGCVLVPWSAACLERASTAHMLGAFGRRAQRHVSRAAVAALAAAAGAAGAGARTAAAAAWVRTVGRDCAAPGGVDAQHDCLHLCARVWGRRGAGAGG